MSGWNYEWPLVARFLDRRAELDRLDEWWASPELMPMNLYGRRRVGKSWLCRRFAHGKPAVVLVAERLATGVQLSRFSAQLGALDRGVAPDLPDVAGLIRTLFRLAADQKLLAVIDEFPWLLGTTESEVERTLSQVQAVMEEERDTSRLKLIVCGSSVGQMEALQGERNPLHGRLVPLEIRPLDVAGASLFLGSLGPVERFERYSITGGTPRYLAALGGRSLRSAVSGQLLRPDSPLWNEGRTIVAQELREPAVHFAALEQLASGEKELGEIAGKLRMDGGAVSKYLATLESLRLVRRRLPLGAAPTARGGHWALEDPFLRFWFRFVFPFQADLEAGLVPEDLYDKAIAPLLGDHAAPVFEEVCRSHTRATYGKVAQRVGRWWGHARHDLRRSGTRFSEEIDIVGLSRNRVTVLGEAKWTSGPVDVNVLHDLAEFKRPALAQAGFEFASDPITIVYSKNGFTKRLRQRAEGDDRLALLDAAGMFAAR